MYELNLYDILISNLYQNHKGEADSEADVSCKNLKPYHLIVYFLFRVHFRNLG